MIPLLVQPISNEESPNILPVPWIRFHRCRFHGIDRLVDAISTSLTQCAPECSTCVFESHCGADPVYHHATQGNALGIKPLSAFCARQKGIMGLLLDILENSPEDAA